MRRYLLTILIAMSLAAAACSSGGTKSVQATTPTVVNGGGAATTTPATTTPAAKSSSGSGGGKFCTDARNAGNTFNNPTNGANPLSDPTLLQKSLNALKSLASEAPSAIRADVNSIVDWYTKFVTAVNDAKGDPQKLAGTMQSLQGDSAALTAASQHIDSYLASTCGISTATTQP